MLRFVHFSNNLDEDRTERSRKFIEILERLEDKFSGACRPGENLVVDETMIPFRGRVE